MNSARFYQVMFLFSLWLSGISNSEEAAKPSSFDWPAPTKVQVTEIANKKGNNAVMSYRIDFSKGGKGYVARMVDLDFSSINGTSVPDRMREALKPAVTAFNSMPSFVINPSGELIDITDLEGMIDATGKMLNEIRKDESGAEIKKAMKADKTKEMIFNLLAEYWVCWVENWIDFPASPDESITEEFEGPLLSGTTPVKGTRIFRHLGNVKDSPHLVHLRTETTITDPSLTKAVKEMLSELDKAKGEAPDADLDSVPEVVLLTIAEVKIDLRNLRPTWAKRSKEVKPKSGKPEIDKIDRVQSHEYFFDWD